MTLDVKICTYNVKLVCFEYTMFYDSEAICVNFGEKRMTFMPFSYKVFNFSGSKGKKIITKFSNDICVFSNFKTCQIRNKKRQILKVGHSLSKSDLK